MSDILLYSEVTEKTNEIDSALNFHNNMEEELRFQNSITEEISNQITGNNLSSESLKVFKILNDDFIKKFNLNRRKYNVERYNENMSMEGFFSMLETAGKKLMEFLRKIMDMIVRAFDSFFDSNKNIKEDLEKIGKDIQKLQPGQQPKQTEFKNDSLSNRLKNNKEEIDTAKVFNSFNILNKSLDYHKGVLSKNTFDLLDTITDDEKETLDNKPVKKLDAVKIIIEHLTSKYEEHLLASSDTKWVKKDSVLMAEIVFCGNKRLIFFTKKSEGLEGVVFHKAELIDLPKNEKHSTGVLKVADVDSLKVFIGIVSENVKTHFPLFKDAKSYFQHFGSALRNNKIYSARDKIKDGISEIMQGSKNQINQWITLAMKTIKESVGFVASLVSILIKYSLLTTRAILDYCRDCYKLYVS